MARKRILVIDDNEDLADGLSELMELRDHEVDVAFTGISGAEAAARNSYDFILVDIGLPDIDGLECARRIRDSGNEAHILLMTGYSTAEIQASARQAGDAELLTKPLDPDRLLNLID